MHVRPSRESGRDPVTPHAAKELCEYLEWDSRFFERRIARVNRKNLTVELTAEILEWARAHQIDCLYFLAASDDPQTIQEAEQNGFQLVDLRITFERALEGAPTAVSGVRVAHAADLPALQRITAEGLTGTRFYSDPHFTRASCDELYRTWIARDYHGHADRVLVADVDGIPSGFVTCSLHPSGVGSIGLIVVDPKCHGQGIGKDLMASALNFFANQGMNKVKAVTQGRNLRSQRLYERSGFFTSSLELWYHRWFDASPRKGALIQR